MISQQMPIDCKFDFSSKTVLVTGAGRGVGAEIAKIFWEFGARVAFTDVDPKTAQSTAELVDPGQERAFWLPLDVRQKSAFETALTEMIERWGRVDIVVNNAGYAKRTPVQEISVDEFDDIVAINMRSVFLSCQVFGPHMRENGYGRIINITSLAGQNGGTVASAHYAAAKAGATMLTKYFAQDLAGSGVTVNAISPGPISTAKGRLSPEQIKMIEGLVPIGRFMEASEIACATALLASAQGGFFMGATLDMNGGLFMR